MPFEPTAVRCVRFLRSKWPVEKCCLLFVFYRHQLLLGSILLRACYARVHTSIYLYVNLCMPVGPSEPPRSKTPLFTAPPPLGARNGRSEPQGRSKWLLEPTRSCSGARNGCSSPPRSRMGAQNGRSSPLGAAGAFEMAARRPLEMATKQS